MFNLLSKPSDQIDFSDVEALIASQVPEDEQMEFKEGLSEKRKSSDPWMEGKEHIEDSVQFCDAPYPIISNSLGCLH